MEWCEKCNMGGIIALLSLIILLSAVVFRYRDLFLCVLLLVFYPALYPLSEIYWATRESRLRRLLWEKAVRCKYDILITSFILSFPFILNGFGFVKSYQEGLLYVLMTPLLLVGILLIPFMLLIFIIPPFNVLWIAPGLLFYGLYLLIRFLYHRVLRKN